MHCSAKHRVIRMHFWETEGSERDRERGGKEGEKEKGRERDEGK